MLFILFFNCIIDIGLWYFLCVDLQGGSKSADQPLTTLKQCEELHS